MNVAIAIVCISLMGVSGALWQRQRRLRREAYIRSFILPRGLYEKLRVHHPDLTIKDCQLVAQGLRQFFLAYLKSGRQYVSMPSQVADDLWHEFILYTKNYQQFCQQAFGRFLHHTPAVVMSPGQKGNVGIRRCWFQACHEENINPHKPTRLPLLFALDSKFNVPNGFVYVADCSGFRRTDGGGGDTYCGADLALIGGTSGCGGGDSDGASGSHGHGHGDSGSHSGDSGCGGGDGCGGGGCGGGGD